MGSSKCEITVILRFKSLAQSISPVINSISHMVVDIQESSRVQKWVSPWGYRKVVTSHRIYPHSDYLPLTSHSTTEACSSCRGSTHPRLPPLDVLWVFFSPPNFLHHKICHQIEYMASLLDTVRQAREMCSQSLLKNHTYLHLLCI